MDLRKATEVVVQDLLQNNQGGLMSEDLEGLDIEKVVQQLTNSDEFLVRFVDMGESLVADYIEENGDELGIW